jgi:class 3 adenylate cyclase
VNVAARLETHSKPGRVLVGAGTAAHLDPAELESVGTLQLKGVSKGEEAYFLVDEVAD